jgi:hypothetical protein
MFHLMMKIASGTDWQNPTFRSFRICSDEWTGLPDFSRPKRTKNRKNYTKWPQTIPNCHKLYQMPEKIFWMVITTFSIPRPPNFTQNRFFGLKINHLATLRMNGSRHFERIKHTMARQSTHFQSEPVLPDGLFLYQKYTFFVFLRA